MFTLSLVLLAVTAHVLTRRCLSLWGDIVHQLIITAFVLSWSSLPCWHKQRTGHCHGVHLLQVGIHGFVLPSQRFSPEVRSLPHSVNVMVLSQQKSLLPTRKSQEHHGFGDVTASSAVWRIFSGLRIFLECHGFHAINLRMFFCGISRKSPQRKSPGCCNSSCRPWKSPQLAWLAALDILEQFGCRCDITGVSQVGMVSRNATCVAWIPESSQSMTAQGDQCDNICHATQWMADCRSDWTVHAISRVSHNNVCCTICWSPQSPDCIG